MSFFPPGFDARADVLGVLDLVSIDTPDGPARFMLGNDGRYRDSAGNDWWGSRLLGASDVQFALQGTAPSAELTLAFDDETAAGAPALIGQLRDLGSDYVRGRAVTFLVVPWTDPDQLLAPVLAPIPFAIRRASAIRFGMQGDMVRQIGLTIEGVGIGRNTARGWVYNTADHARLVGAPNPSLQYIPTDLYQRPDERVF